MLRGRTEEKAAFEAAVYGIVLRVDDCQPFQVAGVAAATLQVTKQLITSLEVVLRKWKRPALESGRS